MEATHEAIPSPRQHANLAALVTAAAADNPDGPALVDANRQVTWAELARECDEVAGGLAGIANSFDQWATGLSATAGFQEFIAYVQQTGPQVVETVASLANALLQIGELVLATRTVLDVDAPLAYPGAAAAIGKQAPQGIDPP